MRGTIKGWSLLIPLLGACSSAERPPAAATVIPSADRTSTPARIYTVGEEHFARGEYAQAVDLWRNAVVELPPTADNDELRHALILRIAYGQLMAWSTSGDTSHLYDAQQMLERYEERHVAIFGETERALAERGEVYELLFEVERALTPVEATADATLADADEDLEQQGEADDEANADGENVRTIVVHTKKRPSVDDPEMVAKLRSVFTDPFSASMVLTAPTAVLLHGPRPLLRADGAATVVGDGGSSGKTRRQARKLGRSLLAAARPALKNCYEAAYSRHPVAIARSTVEVHFDDNGTIDDARIVEGGVVDTLGDLCVIGELEAAPLAANDDDQALSGTSIRLPLTFFYQSPVYFNEGTGSSAPAGVLHQVDSTPGASTPKRGPDGSTVSGRSMGA